MPASAALEDALARTLLVQACEERDPEGRFVPQREREAASRAAREAAPGAAQEAAPGGGAAFVAARAATLGAALEARHASLRAARRAGKLRVPGALVLAASAALGLAADALGGERRVNLLAFPLLALILWNVAVYAGLGLRALAARRAPGAERGGGHAAGLARRIGELAPRAALRVLARPSAAAPDEARWLAAAIADFGRRTLALTGPLHVARAQRALHLGALGFAAGMVAGLYLRGLAYAYRATWESTFLGPAQASALLSFVLGPAACALDALRGADAPSAVALLAPGAIAALEAPGDGPAATWIHLWALTAAAAIGAPRALLAFAAGRRARRLAAGLAPDLDAPYFLRLLAADRGGGVRVEVLPYSHLLAPRSADALRELLHELFGSRAEVALREPLAYGDDPPAQAAGGAALRRVVVFNLAQTPEHEVHGAFLEALRAQDARAELLVLLDEAPYGARLGPGGAERLAERRRAWERLAREAGLRLAALPGEGARDEGLAAARAALAPAAGPHP